MLTLKVTGMDCNHCVETVSKAVRGVAGATGVTVDLASGDVRVEGTPDAADVKAAIERAGYDVAA
jgi:copper chaperone